MFRSRLPSKGPAATHGEVWICSISKAVPISIGRGENRGREITYHNVVRNLLKVGDWNGTSGSWTVPLENISREGVDAAVVYVQDGNRDKPGADAGRGLHVAALNPSYPARSSTPSFRGAPLSASPESDQSTRSWILSSAAQAVSGTSG